MAYIVGIGGGSGSGKGTISSLIEKYLQKWDVRCFVLSSDDCYKDLSFMSSEERDGLCFNPDFNFDHPRSVDFDRLLGYVRRLKEGKSFPLPRYDFTLHSYGDKKTDVPGNLEVGLVEGIYALYSGVEVGRELLKLYDQRIFVVTQPEIALIRRIRRDLVERGREMEHVLRQLETTMVPMHHQFIYPTRVNANDVIDWQGDKTGNEDAEQLLRIARQKAMSIYEAVRGKSLAEIVRSEIDISGIE